MTAKGVQALVNRLGLLLGPCWGLPHDVPAPIRASHSPASQPTRPMLAATAQAVRPTVPAQAPRSAQAPRRPVHPAKSQQRRAGHRCRAVAPQQQGLAAAQHMAAAAAVAADPAALQELVEDAVVWASQHGLVREQGGVGNRPGRGLQGRLAGMRRLGQRPLCLFAFWPLCHIFISGPIPLDNLLNPNLPPAAGGSGH